MLMNGVPRERIELITGFTATVNTELTVGTVEETVTVRSLAQFIPGMTISTPVTNRLLFEAGGSVYRQDIRTVLSPGVTKDTIIGSRDTWGTLLRAKGFAIRGHRLQRLGRDRASMPTRVDLDECP